MGYQEQWSNWHTVTVIPIVKQGNIPVFIECPYESWKRTRPPWKSFERIYVLTPWCMYICGTYRIEIYVRSRRAHFRQPCTLHGSSPIRCHWCPALCLPSCLVLSIPPARPQMVPILLLRWTKAWHNFSCSRHHSDRDIRSRYGWWCCTALRYLGGKNDQFLLWNWGVDGYILGTFGIRNAKKGFSPFSEFRTFSDKS